MSTTPSTDVAVVDEIEASSAGLDVASIIKGLASNELQMYSSVKGDDKAAKFKVLAAMTDSESLGDHLREKFEVQDFVIQKIQMPDAKTGEMRDVPRIILITTKGKAYHAISGGILMSLQNFVGVLGEPGVVEGNWPIPVVCDEVKTRAGFRAMTLKLA